MTGVLKNILDKTVPSSPTHVLLIFDEVEMLVRNIYGLLPAAQLVQYEARSM